MSGALNTFGINAASLNGIGGEGPPIVTEVLAEAAVVIGAAAASVPYPSQLLAETAVVASATVLFPGLDVEDRLAAFDSSLPSTNHKYVHTDGLAVAGEATGTKREFYACSESAIISDATHTRYPPVTLSEYTTIFGGELAAHHVPESISETLIGSEGTQITIGAALSEALGTSQDYAVCTQGVVDDQATITDSTLVVLGLQNMLGSQVYVDEEMLGRTTLRPTVQEYLYADDRAIAPVAPEGDSAWTANVSNWAMSRYPSTYYTGMSENLACGPQGIYVRGAETMTSSFVTGDLDAGTPKKKRLEWIYTVSKCSTAMKVDVAGDVNGARRTTTYTQLGRLATDPRIAKTQVGKGFHSNFYQVRHSARTPLEVYGADLVFAETDRRV